MFLIYYIRVLIHLSGHYIFSQSNSSSRKILLGYDYLMLSVLLSLTLKTMYLQSLCFGITYNCFLYALMANQVKNLISDLIRASSSSFLENTQSDSSLVLIRDGYPIFLKPFKKAKDGFVTIYVVFVLFLESLAALTLHVIFLYTSIYISVTIMSSKLLLLR